MQFHDSRWRIRIGAAIGAVTGSRIAAADEKWRDLR